MLFSRYFTASLIHKPINKKSASAGLNSLGLNLVSTFKIISFPHSRYSILSFSELASYVSSFSRVSFHYLLIAFTTTFKSISVLHHENAVVPSYTSQGKVKDNPLLNSEENYTFCFQHRKTLRALHEEQFHLKQKTVVRSQS